MELALYQIDAFAQRIFAGNPAAVCPLEAWLEDDVLQAIAAENNLSETAFFIPAPEKGRGHFDLRWFTPTDEVDLCGHATLASGHVLLNDLLPDLTEITFHTRSGPLVVSRLGDGQICLDFPALPAEPVDNPDPILDRLESHLGVRPGSLLRAVNLLAVYEREEDIRRLKGDDGLRDALMEADAWGLIVTAPGREGAEHDFVSRFFAPLKGVGEDPVTGSAHCTLMPYWAERLGRNSLTGFQASVRGGLVQCRIDPDKPGRVHLSGPCVPYLKGTISLG